MHTYITLEGILSLLGGAKEKRGSEYVCTCPSHDDKKPSLWVTEGEKGIVLKCRANRCSTEDVCRALGIQVSQLFRDPPKGQSRPVQPTNAPKPAARKVRHEDPAQQSYDSYAAAYGRIGQLVKVYPYTDVTGKLLFEVARIRLADGDKTFRQHRPLNPDKGTFPIVKSVPAELRRGILYRMPEVAAAIRDGRPVYVAEGEKDADTLCEMGYCGTSCPGGAKSWTPAHSEALKDADVVILPDNDEPGEAHGQQVADMTLGIAKRVRLARLVEVYPELKHKGDITDLAETVGKEQAKRLLEALLQQTEPMELDLYQQAKNAFDRLQGYCVHNGCICRQTDDGAQVLGTFVALPTCEVVRDDGVQSEMSLEIAGWSSGGKSLKTLRVPMEKFASMSWAPGNWGLAANIMPGNMIKERLRSAITAAGVQVAQQRTIYEHTGWRKIQGHWSYLYHGGALGADGTTVEMDEDRLRLYRLDGGSVTAAAGAQASLDLAMLIKQSISVPLLGLMYLAPLREFQRMGGVTPAFGAMLKGGTSTHKSTTAALFLSHFGQFSEDSLPASFSDTANAIRRKCFSVKDAPIVLDDYHPATNMQDRRKMEAIAQVISRAVGDNADRGRLGADLRLQTGMPPRSFLIMTGEELPDIGESGLSRFYMMEVGKDDIPFNEDFNDLQRRARAGELRAAMRGYLEWLMTQADTLPEQLTEQFYAYRAKATTLLQVRGIHDRFSPMVAHIMIGLTCMLKYMGSLGLMGEEERAYLLEQYWDVVAENSRQQARVTREERPLQLFMTALTEMLNSKQLGVQDLRPNGENTIAAKTIVGYSDNLNYYFYSGVLYGAVVQFYADQNRVFSASERELLRMLREEGICLSSGDGKVTRTKRVNGKVMRLLWIPRWRLEGGTPPTEQKVLPMTETDESLPEGWETTNAET